MDIDTRNTTYNIEMTDAATEIRGKQCRRKKPWVTRDVLDLCDVRRDLEKRREIRSKRIQRSKQDDSERNEES